MKDLRIADFLRLSLVAICVTASSPHAMAEKAQHRKNIGVGTQQNAGFKAPLQARLGKGAIRAQVKELILYAGAQATAAIEFVNLSGEPVYMMMASDSLLFGTCQVGSERFRGLHATMYNPGADVAKYADGEFRRVDPGEQFLLSIRSRTNDLTCQTLSQADDVDVAFALWISDSREVVLLPVRLAAKLHKGQ